MLASSRAPRAAANTPGGINPAPTNKFCASGQTGTAATHPDDRRAGCPHPAAPRGGANARGRDKSRPYGRRRAPGRPGSDIPALQQTSVGDDACIVPRTPRRRKHPGRDLRPKSRRCAAVGLRNAPAGAVNPAPTNEFCASGRTGTAATHPDDRRAGCPHPAAPRGTANAPGGYGIRPYGRRQTPRNGRDRPPPHRHPAPLHKGAFLLHFLQKRRALFVASARRRGHPTKFYNFSTPRGVFTAGHSWYDRTMYPP